MHHLLSYYLQKRIIALSILISTLSFPSMLQAEPISLNAVMSPEEQAATGISRLTDNERDNLQEWLGNWTRKIIQQAGGDDSELLFDDWTRKISKEPDDVRDSTSTKHNPYTRLQLAKNYGNGQVFWLNDGSIWDIAPFDQLVARRWRISDPIALSHRDDDFYPDILINQRRLEQVCARLKSKASPENREQLENQDFSGSFIVNGVRNRGEIIELADGTIWKIALADQVRAWGWRRGHHVRVRSTRDAQYSYELSNLDTGETVQADPFAESGP